MTTTPTITCPAWCTFDHEASAERLRELSALDGLLSQETVEADIAALREDHSRRVGKHVDIVSDTDNPSPRIMVFVDEPDEMKSAGQARALAADLIVAADKLDEILGAS